MMRRSGLGIPAWRWAVCACAAVLLLLPVIAQWSGIRIIMVDGYSMEPSFMRGDVLLVGDPTGDDLRLGAPVLIGDAPTTYVHRVVEVRDGRALLQGDGNSVPDSRWVTEAEVTGTVLLHAPQPFAAVLSAVSHTAGKIVLLVVMLACVLVPTRRRETTAHAG